jgi:putative Holliday junction resolvase
MDNNSEIKGRLAAIDYGSARVGYAVSDPLRIIAVSRAFFNRRSNNFWELLLASLKDDEIKAVIVGVPYRHDDSSSEVIKEIEEFIDELKLRSGLDVIPYDEAFSTRKAVGAMISAGKKKKKRSSKGEKDKVAAAIILQEYLDENSVQRY